MWFEGDALTQLVRQHPTELARIDAHFGTQWSSTALDREVPVCANCGTEMVSREFKQAPGLPMRACTQCKSLWLANGQLAQLQAIIAPSAQPEPAGTAQCPSCGEKNPPEATMCWACGKVLRAAPPPPTQDTAARPATATSPPPRPASLRPPPESSGFKERFLDLPLWVLFVVVGGVGALTGLVFLILGTAAAAGSNTDTNSIRQWFTLGPLLVPLFAALLIVAWLLRTFVLWIGLWITALIGGSGFQVAFWEGYRHFLPVTMLMGFVIAISFVLLLFLGPIIFLLPLVGNILLLRYFLELEWFEIILLSLVLNVMSCLTGGLL
jgi:Zn-finger nucleic acid-binding protein